MRKISTLAAALLLPTAASAALVDYCGEINTAPDLTQNNPRYYDNPHGRDCGSSSLPGFNAIPGLSNRICREINDASESALDAVNQAVDRSLDQISRDIRNQVNSIDRSVNRSSGGNSRNNTPTPNTNASSFVDAEPPAGLSAQARAAFRALQERERKKAEAEAQRAAEARAAEAKRESSGRTITEPEPASPYDSYYN